MAPARIMAPAADLGLPSETYYDTEDPAQASRQAIVVRTRRAFTDFPDVETSQPVGPWRTIEVEKRASDAWLLVGRRHSVDERRDAMEQGKALFLRSLAERADGVWRTRTAARADDLQALEESVHAQLARQACALQATRDFWAERHSCDHAYLGRLESCASAASSVAMPANQARQESEWRASIQRVAEESATWANQLPDLVASHAKAAGQVRRAVAAAMSETREASKFVRAARRDVWLVTPAAMAHLPGSHTPDNGPEGPCLWQTVMRYLAACDGLQTSQTLALSRLGREEQRALALGEWVDRVLGAKDSPAALSPTSLLNSIPEQANFGSRELLCRSAGGNGGDLDMSVDLSALIVHEQQVDIRRVEGERDVWVPARILMSVDLWLHIWTSDMPSLSPPLDSIPLARACLRPVAEVTTDNPYVLRFLFRPPAAPSFLQKVGNLLWRVHMTKPGTLWLRCENTAATGELLSALELVERLYPIMS